MRNKTIVLNVVLTHSIYVIFCFFFIFENYRIFIKHIFCMWYLFAGKKQKQQQHSTSMDSINFI